MVDNCKKKMREDPSVQGRLTVDPNDGTHLNCSLVCGSNLL